MKIVGRITTWEILGTTQMHIWKLNQFQVNLNLATIKLALLELSQIRSKVVVWFFPNLLLLLFSTLLIIYLEASIFLFLIFCQYFFFYQDTKKKKKISNLKSIRLFQDWLTRLNNDRIQVNPEYDFLCFYSPSFFFLIFQILHKHNSLLSYFMIL